MAVVQVTTLTVKPDRYQEYVDQVARKAKAIIEKSGGKNVRLLAGLVAGEATGTMAFTVEADDFSSYGAIWDRLLADPELVALMSTGSASPTAAYQTSLWVDVPL
jgi:hypothetical protein